MRGNLANYSVLWQEPDDATLSLAAIRYDKISGHFIVILLYSVHPCIDEVAQSGCSLDWEILLNINGQ